MNVCAYVCIKIVSEMYSKITIVDKQFDLSFGQPV